MALQFMQKANLKEQNIFTKIDESKSYNSK